MERRESLYLDLIRALAAFFVIIDHAPTIFAMPHAPRWGHQAVIVFFVISGCVISHVADTREQSARDFLIARMSRLWSVLVPALLLTIVCDSFGRHFGYDSRAYLDVPHDLPVVRIGAALTFTSESWVSIQPLSNGVIWSLCAEFWYYLLFAAWRFLPPGRTKVLVLGSLALLAGFKALLLLPVWVLGVIIERWRAPRGWPVAVLATIWGVSTALTAWILAYRIYNIPIDWVKESLSPWVFAQLAQSRVFWFDWVFGLIVAAGFVGARGVMRFVPVERVAPAIRWVAGISFAAYLFHLPILTLTGAFLPESMGWTAVGITCLVISAVGTPVEQTKHWWRRQLEGVWVAVSTMPFARKVLRA